MATKQKIEQEIQNLVAELATLRLPHKLNQYRVYERKLRSVEKQIKEVADHSLQERFKTELDQLQSTLDRAVLCGVSQCFICGGENADVQLGSPKQFPVYSRSVSAHANYNNQRGKLPFSESNTSNRQYGKQISYHGKVINSAASEKRVSSPPPPPPQPDIVPTLSTQQQNPPILSSPSPSLSPSISLTPSPSSSPTPYSPIPTMSPLPPFEKEEEEVKEKISIEIEKKEVAVENGGSSSDNISKGTAIIHNPEMTTAKNSTPTPPASPKITRTVNSPNKPSTPPPPPPLSPKPHPRSPSPKFTGGPSSNAVNGNIKKGPEKPVLPPPPPPSSVSPQPTVRPKSTAVSGTLATSSSITTTSKTSIFSAAPFRSTASSYRAYKDFISSYTTSNK